MHAWCPWPIAQEARSSQIWTLLELPSVAEKSWSLATSQQTRSTRRLPLVPSPSTPVSRQPSSRCRSLACRHGRMRVGPIPLSRLGSVDELEWGRGRRSSLLFPHAKPVLPPFSTLARRREACTPSCVAPASAASAAAGRRLLTRLGSAWHHGWLTESEPRLLVEGRTEGRRRVRRVAARTHARTQLGSCLLLRRSMELRGR
jgi:hypothetical protein